MNKIIRAVESVPGIKNWHKVRIRYSGPQMFVDLHMLIDGSVSFRRVHGLTEQIERTISNIVPNADVTVHPEPL